MELPVSHVRPNVTRMTFDAQVGWTLCIEEYKLAMNSKLSPFSFKLTCRASHELCHEETSYARVSHAGIVNTVSKAKVSVKKGVIPWHRASVGLLMDFQLATFVLSSHQVNRLRKAHRAEFDLLVAHLRERTQIYTQRRVMHYVGSVLDIPELIPDEQVHLRDPTVVYCEEDVATEPVKVVESSKTCKICQDMRVEYVECSKCSESVCTNCVLGIRAQHVDAMYRCPYCRYTHQ